MNLLQVLKVVDIPRVKITLHILLICKHYNYAVKNNNGSNGKADQYSIVPYSFLVFPFAAFLHIHISDYQMLWFIFQITLTFNYVINYMSILANVLGYKLPHRTTKIFLKSHATSPYQSFTFLESNLNFVTSPMFNEKHYFPISK